MKQAIKMSQMSKRFGDVIANHDVCLEANYHQVHALLGENGAGKSTLMNILSGIYAPDAGVIMISQKRVTISSPKKASQLGIGMVHQHVKLVDSLTVLESIVVQNGHAFFRTTKKDRQFVQAMMDKHHLQLPLDALIGSLSVSQKQYVEILKVLYMGAKILIFDEPTAVLTDHETESLYNVLTSLKQDGCCVIVITHKLNEVLSYADEVTVMHQGTSVYHGIVAGMTEKELASLMVGDDVDLHIPYEQTNIGSTILRLEHMGLMNQQTNVLSNISLDLHEGEIIGVAGIAGSGQKELCEAIAGIRSIDQGAIYFYDNQINGLSPRQIATMGIRLSFIPEDRLQMGLVPSMSIVDNVLLSDYYKQKGLLKRTNASIKAKQMVESLSIVAPSIETPVGLLSGGNIQKVLLGRELQQAPKVMITAYAVRGLDVQSTHQIYELLNKQKKQGCGILFIGEDLDVLLTFCDRIAVLCDGLLMGVEKSNQLNKQMIGQMMAGKTLEALYDIH